MVNWTDAGAEQISTGIYRVPLPLPSDGLRAVNVYLVEGSDRLTCIDGGWAIEAARTQLESSMKPLGYHPRDIGTFLVTHVHRDHYTQAVSIRREFGNAEIWLGEGEREALEYIQAPSGRSPFVERLLRSGADALARAWADGRGNGEASGALDWASPDRWIDTDRSLAVGRRRLDVVATPGHTAGHVVFVDSDEGLLFAGDHVLPRITPSVGFSVGADVAPGRLPLADYLASLRRVRALPDLRLLPAHGPADRRSHDRIDELLAHHDTRLEECLEGVRAGAHTAFEVASALSWTRGRCHLDGLDTFNGGLAVLETLLHLDLLVAQGRLSGDRSRTVDEFAVPEEVAP